MPWSVLLNVYWVIFFVARGILPFSSLLRDGRNQKPTFFIVATCFRRAQFPIELMWDNRDPHHPTSSILTTLVRLFLLSTIWPCLMPQVVISNCSDALDSTTHTLPLLLVSFQKYILIIHHWVSNQYTILHFILFVGVASFKPHFASCRIFSSFYTYTCTKYQIY